MRRVFIVSVFSLTAFAIILATGVVDPAAGVTSGLQARPVNIRVSCTAGEVDDVNIRPWTASVSREARQQLTWRLVGNGISSATVRPKSTSQWPFGSTPPLTVTSGAGTSSGPITRDNGSYFYDIVVNCGNGDTVIDPRMDIRP